MSWVWEKGLHYGIWEVLMQRNVRAKDLQILFPLSAGVSLVKTWHFELNHQSASSSPITSDPFSKSHIGGARFRISFCIWYLDRKWLSTWRETFFFFCLFQLHGSRRDTNGFTWLRGGQKNWTAWTDGWSEETTFDPGTLFFFFPSHTSLSGSPFWPCQRICYS